MTVKIYGIPTCSSCKKAQTWLRERDLSFESMNLKEVGLKVSEIENWVSVLGSKALKNTSGQSYRTMGPERDEMTDTDWIAAFASDPMLIKRPVLVDGEKPVAAGFKVKVYEDYFKK